MKKLLIGILIILVGAGIGFLAYSLQFQSLAMLGGLITGFGVGCFIDEVL